MPVILGCFLSGCASSSYDIADLIQEPKKVSSSLALVTVNAPRFNDRKPHEWGNKNPWQYPVHGTDVSKYQGAIDWASVAKSGISFAFIKATEGGDRVDEYFVRNWNGTKQVGLPRGAYHFYYYCRSAQDQAKWFIKNVPKDNSALPPVLDMEWNHLSPTCKIRPPAATIRSEMRVFLSMIEKHYGKKPIIYTTVDFFDRNDLDQIKGYNFWLRSVAGHPEEKYGPHPWTFWQYTGTGTIPGITGDVDINVFTGSRNDWKKFVNNG
ncbi:glycoside hydrolase family 25 protein [Bartonella tamiae]|uniref:glycoside hydrolase family 25 protein n=1 Tax=Bartonella tamiae TaxID=373638 RepID=UPI001FDA5A69|nr:glycoside hydrolase family 25 protein [Bartonella tamiae]